MKIEVDQSGHVEYTSHNTVVAFSNGKKKAILLKARDKREIQEVFRIIGKQKIFVIRIFALLIFLLLREEKNISDITIDIEYPGWDAQIKNYLLADFAAIGRKIEPERIIFGNIGKKSEAHWHAYYVFKKQRRPEITLEAKEVLSELLRM